MPHHHHITRVGATARPEPYACIAYVGGGDAANGTEWRLSQAEAVDYIESGRGRLWLRCEGRSRWVVVARLNRWHKYLKTQDDEDMPWSLLGLAAEPPIAGTERRSRRTLRYFST
ncbi:MAG: DUF3892 domain-containing protein [Gammaproteobacteria bacterium]|nr:DUF3892 domain-containing protein [Gammaproteobacteria bacterium]